MSLKRIYPLVSVALLSAVFFACSNDSSLGTETAADVLVSQERNVEDQKVDEQKTDEQKAEEQALEAQSADEQPDDDGVSGKSKQLVNEDSVVSEIFDILFPDGIEGVDTARHEPDSVGVWHFYDPRGTHDNPDFAYGEMTDPRDGIVYKTTTIGGQVWMAENLNYFDIEGASSSIKNDWCYWDKSENCESAGRLYTWKVAQRICPEGWRLPTKSDWESLLQEVGADSLNEILWNGSSKLKSVSGWENEGSGTDDFGFTALPAGMKFTTSTQDGFTYHGCSSLMWAATEADGGAADSLAYHMYLDCSNDNAIVNTVRKVNGLSVRCVKE